MKRNQRVNSIKFEWGAEALGLMYFFSIILRFNADLLILLYHGACNFP